ncbi:MAG: hypothetical protein AAFR61_20340 [Bacteroidota bacterium]
MPIPKVLPQAQSGNQAPKAAGNLTIHVHSNRNHPCSMSETQKQIQQENAPELGELFQETLAQKGQADQTNIEWLGPDEVVVEGLSHMTLHSFILKAEALGKSVCYTKTLTVKITD